MPKAVNLANGRKWRSRKDAIEHFKKMLARYKDGDKVSNPVDDSDLRALLALYDSVVPPGSPTKTGTGVAHFSRQRNSGDGWATSGFHVHRSDGTSIDFSFYSAVRIDPPD
jgi:hypothetical protein